MQRLFNRFFHAMLGEGVYLAPSAFEAGFVSAAHGSAEIEKTITAAGRAFPTLKIVTRGLRAVAGPVRHAASWVARRLMQSLDVLSKRRYFHGRSAFGRRAHHPVRIVRALADPELFELLFGVLGVLPGEAGVLRRHAGAIRTMARRASGNVPGHHATTINRLSELNELGIACGAGLGLLPREIQRKVCHVFAAKDWRRSRS